MSSPTKTTKRPASAATTRRKKCAPKPQGQWLVGGREPLNDDEHIKKEDADFAIKQHVIDAYPKQGFNSIPAEDLAPRFRWIDLYAQHRQDPNGEHTGVKTNTELQDKYFVLRVRLDGGQTTTEGIRTVGKISRGSTCDTADFSDHQNVQLYWIRVKDMPEIWDRLERTSLDVNFGCGDVPRVILGSPVAGITTDEVADGTNAIRRIKEEYLSGDEFPDLPRKFKSAVSGSPRLDVTHEIQDVTFVSVSHPEHDPDFDVWVGGGLSTNPILAQRLDAWIPEDEVPEVWAGVCHIFRDYGYRHLCNHTRLEFLVAEWGTEKFRQILEDSYLNRELIDGPTPGSFEGDRNHIGVHKQADGLNYVGIKPTVDRVPGSDLVKLAGITEYHGISHVHTTTMEEFILLDVADDQVDSPLAELGEIGLSAKPSTFRRDILACTGLEFCKLVLVATRQRTIGLVGDLEERLGDLDVPITIALNDCPSACARTRITDISLRGQVVIDDEDNRVEGFQVHLSSSLGLDANFDRKAREHKITSAELGDYIERVVNHYKKQRHKGEQLHEWIVRVDEEDLK